MREANKFQQTGEWFNERTGKLTGSRMEAAMSFLKAKKDEEPKEAADRRKLKVEILCERMTGNIVPKYVTLDMQWGNEQEPMAKEFITSKTGWAIRDLGFVEHPSIPLCGCSPDGYIEQENALVEIKCPTSQTHVSWLFAAKQDPKWFPPEHIPQMLLQSACFAGLPVWFASFDPRMPEDQKLLLRKFVPTQVQIDDVEEHARRFLREVETMFDQITLRD